MGAYLSDEFSGVSLSLTVSNRVLSKSPVLVLFLFFSRKAHLATR